MNRIASNSGSLIEQDENKNVANLRNIKKNKHLKKGSQNNTKYLKKLGGIRRDERHGPTKARLSTRKYDEATDTNGIRFSSLRRHNSELNEDIENNNIAPEQINEETVTKISIQKPASGMNGEENNRQSLLVRSAALEICPVSEKKPESTISHQQSSREEAGNVGTPIHGTHNNDVGKFHQNNDTKKHQPRVKALHKEATSVNVRGTNPSKWNNSDYKMLEKCSHNDRHVVSLVWLAGNNKLSSHLKTQSKMRTLGKKRASTTLEDPCFSNNKQNDCLNGDTQNDSLQLIKSQSAICQKNALLTVNIPECSKVIVANLITPASRAEDEWLLSTSMLKNHAILLNGIVSIYAQQIHCLCSDTAYFYSRFMSALMAINEIKKKRKRNSLKTRYIDDTGITEHTNKMQTTGFFDHLTHGEQNLFLQDLTFQDYPALSDMNSVYASSEAGPIANWESVYDDAFTRHDMSEDDGSCTMRSGCSFRRSGIPNVFDAEIRRLNALQTSNINTRPQDNNDGFTSDYNMKIDDGQWKSATYPRDGDLFFPRSRGTSIVGSSIDFSSKLGDTFNSFGATINDTYGTMGHGETMCDAEDIKPRTSLINKFVDDATYSEDIYLCDKSLEVDSSVQKEQSQLTLMARARQLIYKERISNKVRAVSEKRCAYLVSVLESKKPNILSQKVNRTTEISHFSNNENEMNKNDYFGNGYDNLFIPDGGEHEWNGSINGSTPAHTITSLRSSAIENRFSNMFEGETIRTNHSTIGRTTDITDNMFATTPRDHIQTFSDQTAISSGVLDIYRKPGKFQLNITTDERANNKNSDGTVTSNLGLRLPSATQNMETTEQLHCFLKNALLGNESKALTNDHSSPDEQSIERHAVDKDKPQIEFGTLCPYTQNTRRTAVQIFDDLLRLATMQKIRLEQTRAFDSIYISL